MVRSIKANFLYNIINTVSSLLFPLIAFSYAARIILANGIGQVQFFQSIISYIVLLTSMGIPMYGIREIARVRDNKKMLAKTTIEIFVLNLLFSLVGYILVVALCFFLPQIHENIPLFLILSSSILLTTLGCSWFYNGIEDFKYITILGIIIKCLSLLFLFCFVRSKADVLSYGIYTILGSVGCNIVNFVRLQKYVRLGECKMTDLDVFKHIKPTCSIFVFNIVTSIYINLDTVMLGFLRDTLSVGYYTAATKISHILVTIITSFGAVLLPRSSNLIKNEQFGEFERLSKKSYDLVMFLSLPIFAGILVCAPYLISIFSGDDFEPAVCTLRIVSPIIVALGISNLIGIQILYPLGKIKLVTISTCVGAIVNIVFNLILIPRYSQNGAAIATLFAEWGVTLAQCFLARNIIPFKLLNIQVRRYAFSSFIMLIVCYLVSGIFENVYANLLIILFSGILVYCLFMQIYKDQIFGEVLKMLFKRTKLNR